MSQPSTDDSPSNYRGLTGTEESNPDESNSSLSNGVKEGNLFHSAKGERATADSNADTSPAILKIVSAPRRVPEDEFVTDEDKRYGSREIYKFWTKLSVSDKKDVEKMKKGAKVAVVKCNGFRKGCDQAYWADIDKLTNHTAVCRHIPLCIREHAKYLRGKTCN
jgi:hypothetical protein